MAARWPSRSERAKEIADEAMALAHRARSAGFEVPAYILELAATEARKVIQDEAKKNG
jgi:hypothetical protein